MVSPHPSFIVPVNPGGQESGSQQVPSVMQMSPLGHSMQTMFGLPHPALIALHDGVFTSAQVSGLQQEPS
jgi:hypothetical protein